MVSAQGWPPKFTARVGDKQLSSHSVSAQGWPPKITARVGDRQLYSHPVFAKGLPPKFTAKIRDQSLPKANDLPSSLRVLDVRNSRSEELRRQCRKLVGTIPVVYA